MDIKLSSKNNNYKIYDCFMYYDEAMLLEFRLNYLNKYEQYQKLNQIIKNYI